MIIMLFEIARDMLCQQEGWDAIKDEQLKGESIEDIHKNVSVPEWNSGSGTETRANLGRYDIFLWHHVN